ncbi:MAG: pyridoxine 5'-phosphate synthase [Phycisphaerales bacterium]
MIAIARRIKPQMAMLVPEGRQEVTTEGGLDVAAQRRRLRGVVARLRDAGMGVSFFIDAEPAQVEAAAECGADVCEVHTGPFAHLFFDHGRDVRHELVQQELERIAGAGRLIQRCGMQFNAGHALNYVNVAPIAALRGVAELHIGHAIVSRAFFVGMRTAVAEMVALVGR